MITILSLLGSMSTGFAMADQPRLSFQPLFPSEIRAIDVIQNSFIQFSADQTTPCDMDTSEDYTGEVFGDTFVDSVGRSWNRVEELFVIPEGDEESTPFIDETQHNEWNNNAWNIIRNLLDNNEPIGVSRRNFLNEAP